MTDSWDETPAGRWFRAGLKKIAPLLRLADDERHPSSAVLSAYVDDVLDSESAGELRVHLVYCDECAGVVAALERVQREQEAQEGGRLFSFPVERLRVLAPPSLAPALAAAEPSRGSSYETHRLGNVLLAITISTRDELHVWVERDGRAVSEAMVRVELVRPNDQALMLVECETSDDGAASLGRVSSFRSPAAGEQYRVVVSLPEE